jgi:nucleoside-diphosphate kinase
MKKENIEKQTESAKTERTFVMIKPDGVQKKLVGEVIKRIESTGLIIEEMMISRFDKDICKKFYHEAISKFPWMEKEIIEYITGGKIVALIVEGHDAVNKVRSIRGTANPSKSPIGTIRGDFAGHLDSDLLTSQKKLTRNIIHSSGSKEEAEMEIKIVFD